MFSSISDPLKPLIFRGFLNICHQLLEKSLIFPIGIPVIAGSNKCKTPAGYFLISGRGIPAYYHLLYA